MSYNLFLDDKREPEGCRSYPGDGSVYETENWLVVRSYYAFCSVIAEIGLPKLVSFDYDLNDSKTGLDCATFLFNECKRTKTILPKYMVHSQWPGIYGKFVEIMKTK